MGAGARYWELTLTISADATEGLTNFLWENGALGVVEEEYPGAPPALRAFFPETAPPAILTERVTAYVDGLITLGFGAIGRPEVVALEDTGWADAWRAHFRPMTVGRRFLVTPPWETPAAAGRILLVIEPGRAFGTGHHGSTAGCLEALETAVEDGVPSRAFDLGTGSGILAIALARLGVADVLAIDEDPDAIAAATVDRNGTTAAVRCRIENAAALEVDPAPLVVANLITAAHTRLADRYRHYVTPGGRLILSGILDGETDGVDAAMRARGWRPGARVTREGWSTLTVTRPAP